MIDIAIMKAENDKMYLLENWALWVNKYWVCLDSAIEIKLRALVEKHALAISWTRKSKINWKLRVIRDLKTDNIGQPSNAVFAKPANTAGQRRKSVIMAIVLINKLRDWAADCTPGSWKFTVAGLSFVHPSCKKKTNRHFCLERYGARKNEAQNVYRCA